MAVAAGPTGRFDLGIVVQRTFSTIGRNFVVFGMLALLLAGVPAALTGILVALAITGSPFSPPATPDDSSLVLGGAAFAVTTLVAAVAAFILQGAITYGAVADLNGRRATLAECLSTGLRHAGWLFLLAIVVSIAELFGYILLIVPGVMMATAWLVAVPAQVVERAGVFGSMSRSADLTRGHRWAIFGLMVAFLIGSSVLQGAMLGVIGSLAISAPSAAQVVSQAILRPLVTTISTLVAAAGVASIYYELRSAREGVGPEALAAVFD